MPAHPPRTRTTRIVALALIAPITALVAVPSLGAAAPAGAATAVAPMVATGGEHTCALMTDGTLRCWGRNDSGQLGDGTFDGPRLNPVAVEGLSGVTAITAGVAHTCALLADGTVRCWGSNGSGQLGDATTVDRSSPVTVTGLDGVTALSAGNDHTCAVLAGGTVRCWGNNGFGQLGDGTMTDRTTPVAVPGLDGVTAIAAGGVHSCVLVLGGEVRCWGNNVFGQLGDGTDTSRSSPVRVLASGTEADTPSPLAGSTALAARGAHTCAIVRDPDDQFLCWGRNLEGQLGDGTFDGPRLNPVRVLASGTEATVPVELTAVAAVAAGTLHTCARLGDGTVRCWGAGSLGKLGDGGTVDRSSPVIVSGLEDVAVLAVGGSHACALLTDDTIRCWGDGGSGRLGDGATQARTSPVAVLASGTATVSPVTFSLRPASAPLTPRPPAPAPAITVSCTPAAITVGTEVTCTVSGGDPGVDVLWRAAVNPVIAEAGMTLDADGAGTFTFTVPPSAVGATLTVELVAWSAPVALGIVGPAGGPVPTAVPAGEGTAPARAGLAVLAVLALAGAERALRGH